MIAIIDYGMGNLRSVQKAFERLGHAAEITCDPQRIRAAEKVVLPGVGAFGDGIAEVRRRGLAEPIREVIDDGKPFLGICLGLQLLFTTGFEDGEQPGLDILQGQVVRFTGRAQSREPATNSAAVPSESPSASGSRLSTLDSSGSQLSTLDSRLYASGSRLSTLDSRLSLKVPHMGWNQLQLRRPGPLLEGIAEGTYMYFVHSYYAVPEDRTIVAAETSYPDPFASVIWRENVFATQFHPEKSQQAGLRLLRNFAEM